MHPSNILLTLSNILCNPPTFYVPTHARQRRILDWLQRILEGVHRILDGLLEGARRHIEFWRGYVECGGGQRIWREISRILGGVCRILEGVAR